jgi:hypothetical protein
MIKSKPVWHFTWEEGRSSHECLSKDCRVVFTLSFHSSKIKEFPLPIFVNHVSCKGILSYLHKEYIKLKKKMNNQIENGHKIWKDISKEDKHMANILQNVTILYFIRVILKNTQDSCPISAYERFFQIFHFRILHFCLSVLLTFFHLNIFTRLLKG